MKVIDWSGLSPERQAETLARPAPDSVDRQRIVEGIIAEVRTDGDRALRRLSQQFDGFDPDPLAVPEDELRQAAAGVPTDLLTAIDSAIERIESFHQAGKPSPISIDTAPGLRCEARYLPISPVGLYIPGGTAPLISTVLMLAIPARIAACDEVVLSTPAGKNGQVDPAILAAAWRCGVRRVFRIGGAQAIAAMAYGTESVPRCVKLFGPGNAWVTEAKRQVSSDPRGAAQDMPAGPSEVLVIADDSADATAVCWDLLSQAEHGPDSQVILLSDSETLLKTVAQQLPGMADALPRSDILASSIGHTRLIQVDGLSRAVAISNQYAPEHLILNCRNAEKLADRVTTAGSVFIGPWTPESLGDYCSGTNHVLPTYGYARAYSGLSVTDFMRRMTLQKADPQGLQTAGPVASRLAAAEGLEAHRQAVEYRLSRIKSTGDQQ
jgi:histidinol dehydrogenase